MKPFSRWRADVPKPGLTITSLKRNAANGEYQERVMQNVVAINAAARQGIIAAQATSDEMLLQSISDGGRTAMHILYSRHNVQVYRFILRIVRDTTMAEDLVSQVFLDVWRTAAQFEGRSQVSTWLLSIARFKALTALRQRRHEDIDQEDVLEIADQADTPASSQDQWQPILAAAEAIARGTAPRETVDALNTLFGELAADDDWAALIPVLRRIIAGDHPPDLLHGLDPTDTAIATDLLDRFNPNP
jgi:RNA polymerase sigma factor (sigma-70 family)